MVNKTKSPKKKIRRVTQKAIEDFDSKVAGTILKGMDESGEDYIILVMPDHLTPISVRTHVHGSIPFAACGTVIKSDDTNNFGEVSAGLSKLKFDKGHELLSYLVEMSKQ